MIQVHALTKRYGPTTVLDKLPLIERLQELPRLELRYLFDSLRLQVAFQPAEAAVDVEVALFADDPPDLRREVAEVQSVPPAGLEPAHPAPEAGALSSELRGRNGGDGLDATGILATGRSPSSRLVFA